MNGLGDSLTIGILLTLIFGAVAFYLYSRLTQNEKRVALLENLLLTLKMSTEASLGGPDSVEAVSSPAPITNEDMEGVDEENYADLLKEIPTASAAQQAPLAPLPEEDENEDNGSQSSASSHKSASSAPAPTAEVQEAPRQMEVSYESMTVKELTALAKQRGINGVQPRKAELIAALKRQGSAPAAPQPLPEDNDFADANTGSGFSVDM